MKANAKKINIKLMGLHLTGHRIRHQNAVFYSWSSYICCPHHCLKIAVSLKNKAIYMNKQLISLINFLISPSLPFARDTNYKLHPVNSHLTRVPSSFLLLILWSQTKWELAKKKEHTHALFLGFLQNLHVIITLCWNCDMMHKCI